MPDALTVELTPKSLEVLKSLREFPARALQAVRTVLDLQNELSVGYIQRTKLSQKGPSTLGVVTGRLRRSLRPMKAMVVADGVVSGIGSNVAYAGVHEFGFSGTVQVKEFLRRNRQGDKFRINGSSELGRKLVERLGLKKGQVKNAQVASGVSTVHAHSRRVNIPARAMIRTGIQERLPLYVKALEDGLVRAAS